MNGTELALPSNRLNGAAPALAEPIEPPRRYSLPELEQIASYVVQSRMFSGIKTPQQAMTLMLLCEADHLHPMHAVRRYHVMDGRPPMMKADVLLAEFQRARGRVEWEERSDTRVAATFYHPDHGSKGVRIEWTIQQAERAGIASTNPTWKRYPRQMLTARVIGEGVRLVCPGVTNGIYTPEEVEDSAVVVEVAPVAARVPPNPAPPLRSSAPVVETPSLTPPPRAETWLAFAQRSCTEANDAWDVDCKLAGVKDPQARGDWKKLVPSAAVAVNHVVTAAIEAGLIAPAAVDKRDRPGVRDPAAAKETCDWLYAEHGDWVRREVEAWLVARRERAGKELGIDADADAPARGEDPVASEIRDDDQDARGVFGPGADG